MSLLLLFQGSATEDTAYVAPVVATSAGAPQHRRAAAAAVYALSLAFVPVIAAPAAASTPGEQGGVPPAAIRTIQYQAVTGPVFVPAVVGETITLDKWSPRYPDRIVVRRVTPAPATAAPLYVPDVTVTAPSLSWEGVYADRVPARPRSSVFPQAVVPLYVPDVTVAVPPLGWAPDYPDRPARFSPRQSAGQTEPPYQDQAPAETVTLDKWLGSQHHRLILLLRPAGSVVAPVVVPDVTDPAPAVSWRGGYPDRVPGRTRPTVYPQAVAPLYVPDVTSVAPLRSWSPVYPDRAPGFRRPAAFPLAAAPLYVPDVTVVAPPLAWAPVYPSRLARATVRLSGGETLPPRIDVAAETITPDKWGPVYPNRADKLGSIQYQDTGGPVLVPESTIDKWAPRYPDQLSKKTRRIADGTVSPFVVEVAPETITVDKWLGAGGQVRRKFLSPLSTVFAPVFVSDVAPTVVPLSWAPQIPNPVRRPRWAQQAGAEFVAVVAAPVTFGVGNWGFRSVSSVATGTITLSIGLPDGTINGDLMIMTFTHKGSGYGTVPAGWTLISQQISGSTRSEIYWKRASGEGASYSVTGLADTACGAILTYDGEIASGSPVDVSSAQVNASGVRGHAGITTTVNDALILAVTSLGGNFSATSHTVTPSTGIGFHPVYLERIDGGTTNGTDCRVIVAETLFRFAGSTSGYTLTHSDTENVVTLIALIPEPIDVYSVSRFYPGNQSMPVRVFGAIPGTWAGSFDTSRPEFGCNSSYKASPSKLWAGQKDTNSGRIFSTNQQGNYDSVIRQWNIGPVTAQTISGTFDFCFAQSVRWVTPSTIDVDSYVRYKVYIAIMVGDTNEVRHVLLDNLVDSVDLSRTFGEPVGKWQQLASPASIVSGAALEGDHIRVIIGYRIVSSPTPTPIYPSEPYNVDSYSTRIIMYSGFGSCWSSGIGQPDGVNGVTATSGLVNTSWVEFSSPISLLDEGLTAPANNDCANAVEIIDFPHRSNAIDTRAAIGWEREVWYKFTAPRTGTCVVLALGTTYACAFQVLEGATCGTAIGVGYSSYGDVSKGRSISMCQFDTTTGEIYWVRIFNQVVISNNAAFSGGLLQFTLFYQEAPEIDDLYLPAQNLISWRRNENTGELWPVMFSFNTEGSGSALTGVAIDYSGNEVVDNYGAGVGHTDYRILLGFHSLNTVSILDLVTFTELDYINANFSLPLLSLHPAQMAITEDGNLYQAFFGNGYLHIEGSGTLPAILNAVSDVASYSGIRALLATAGDGQAGAVAASIITPDLGSETPSPWAISYQESSGAIFFTMGNIYVPNVGSQQVRKYLGGVTTVFATLPSTSSYLPGLRGLEALPDGTVLVCNGDRAHRLSAAGAIIVTYLSTSRPESFQVCADIKATADGLRVWIVSFDNATLGLFDIGTGEEIAVYDTWQNPIAVVQMAIYQPAGVTITVVSSCPTDFLTEAPRSPLEKFFRVHGVRTRPAVVNPDPVCLPIEPSRRPKLGN